MTDGSERRKVKRRVALLGAVLVAVVLVETLNLGRAATPTAASQHVNHAMRNEFTFTKLRTVDSFH
jgi:hypothetical protein